MDLLTLVARLVLDSTDYEAKMNQAPTIADKAGQMIATAVKTFVGVKAVGALKNFAQESINAGMNFDAAMSQVAATMGKTTGDLEKEVGSVETSFGKFEGNLRDFARYMGENTAFSATEAAEALNYMALAGYKTQESMDMLPNVLNLAAAGNFSLARASDMVTDTQTAFGISFERTTQMVDEMAKAASTGNTSVEQLGDAFLTVGGLAKELNGGLVELEDGSTATVDGIQELEIALTAMANAGVKGGEAGTHMRNMLLKLTAPGKEGKETFEQLGVAVLDSTGNMRSLNDIFSDLSASMSKLTQGEKLEAISNIFNARDTASAEALLAAVSEDWDEIGESILKAKDAAAQMAETQLDNLKGDVTIFKSALEGLQIAISDRVSPALRDMVQSFTTTIGEIKANVENGGLVEAGAQLVQKLFDGFLERTPLLLDRVTNTGIEIVQKIGQGFVGGLPAFFSDALPKILELTTHLRENAGRFVDAGIEFILNLMKGLMNSLPTLIAYVPQIVINIAGVINDNMPKILKMGVQLIAMLINGIALALPDLFANAGKIVEAIFSVISAFNWLSLGSKIITLIGNGLSALAQLPINIIKNIGHSIITTFQNGFSWGTLGHNIIVGIANGVVGAGHVLVDTLMGMANNAWSAVKHFFGIASPSKLMRDTIGKYIPEGMAEGIEDNADSVFDAMDELSNIAMEPLDISKLGTVAGTETTGNTNDSHNMVTLNIYGAEGQDVRELARIVMEEMNKELNSRRVVYA